MLLIGGSSPNFTVCSSFLRQVSLFASGAPPFVPLAASNSKAAGSGLCARRCRAVRARLSSVGVPRFLAPWCFRLSPSAPALFVVGCRRRRVATRRAARAARGFLRSCSNQPRRGGEFSPSAATPGGRKSATSGGGRRGCGRRRSRAACRVSRALAFSCLWAALDRDAGPREICCARPELWERPGF